MNLIDRIILTKGEKALLPFRSTENILKNVTFASYQEILPTIKSCYSEAKYWHGTGRYQYAHASGSRYEDVNFNQQIDILESILKEGGLRPHGEPWMKMMLNVSTPSISMSPFRMYARLYAGLYLYEKDSLQYSFGTAKFWFRFLFLIQILDRKFLWFLVTRGIYKLVRISSYNEIRVYVSSIVGDKKKKYSVPYYIAPFKGYAIRTDIEGNYPVLIGIRNTIKTLSLDRSVGRLESRTINPILLSDITHIEVPLSKVKETEDLLKQKNISLPVTPLEFGEVYCSNFELKELVGVKSQKLE